METENRNIIFCTCADDDESVKRRRMWVGVLLFAFSDAMVLQLLEEICFSFRSLRTRFPSLLSS